MATSQIGLPYLNSYHLDNGLLFQFILAEFLETYQEMQQVSHLAKKLAKSTKPSLRSSRQILIVLYDIAVKLTGSHSSHFPLFSWHLDNGRITKLKNYCIYFAQNAHTLNKELRLLNRNTHRLWQACLAYLELVQRLLNEQKGLDDPSHRESLNKLLEKIMKYMRHFANLLVKIILQFRDNENIIFFLLRHHHEFDLCYGKQFTSKLLNKMFPKGLNESQQFLSNRYAQRGFDDLIPIINAKITQLSGKNICALSKANSSS